MSQLPVGDITSANATLILTVDELFPAGVRLQQFGTDQSYSQGDLAVAENRMGVDGRLVARVPSIGRTFTWTSGVLKSGTLVPAGKKVLEPTSWVFDFADLTITEE